MYYSLNSFKGLIWGIGSGREHARCDFTHFQHVYTATSATYSQSTQPWPVDPQFLWAKCVKTQRASSRPEPGDHIGDSCRAFPFDSLFFFVGGGGGGGGREEGGEMGCVCVCNIRLYNYITYTPNIFPIVVPM